MLHPPTIGIASQLVQQKDAKFLPIGASVLRTHCHLLHVPLCAKLADWYIQLVAAG